MVQPASNVHDLPTDRPVGITSTQLPTQLPAGLPTKLPAKSTNRPATGRQVRARTRAIREVVVLDVAGRLGDVVEELDRAIQLALSGGPRGVVCDLSEVLATAGRHVRDWPGIPVAVACPDHRVREALHAHPLGGHLILTTSLFSAVSEVLATPRLAVERLQLSAHPTAPRAARDYVTRT